LVIHLKKYKSKLIEWRNMTEKPYKEKKPPDRIVEHNEKFNVPEQTE
jgi:hypothetical protein